jgi:hypothetical protein
MHAAWRAPCAKGIERTAMRMIEIGRNGCAPAQRRRKAAGGGWEASPAIESRHSG